MKADQEQRLGFLLERAQAGDNVAYEKFLLETSAELRRFFSSRLVNGEQREDVLQETLFAIHKARHTYLPERPLSPWLYSIAKYKLTDFFRKNMVLLGRELSVEEIPEFALELDMSSHKIDDVEAAYARLPTKQKKIIGLLKFENLSVKEVAAKLGISESAVKITAWRGYKEIRRTLGIKDDENK